jgi:peroxiredoxin (alkyl hydroperoxide reductase subunit C)
MFGRKTLFKTLMLSVLGGMLATISWAGDMLESSRVVAAPDEAPAFTADTTQGKINFPKDYKGKWVILIAYPADFLPVPTTEVLTLAAMNPEFRALNCDLLGISGDSLSAHLGWLRSLQEKIVYKNMKGVYVNFPLIEDSRQEISKKYGGGPNALYFIDPKARIRGVLSYPGNVGRNFMEIKRMLVALQTADAYTVCTPADWQPGEDVLLASPTTAGMARERSEAGGKDFYNLDWYLSLKKIGKDSIPPAPIKKER